MMTTKEIFILGCQKIGDLLIPFGFTSLKKGQLLKKVSSDSLFIYEVYFQSSTLNWNGKVSAWPYITVRSDVLKKWQKQKYNMDASGIIFQARLEELTPLKNKNYDWNMALSNQENIIGRLFELIRTYAIPLFEKFENKDEVVHFIAENGIKFNEHIDSKLTSLPVDFLCCFGGQHIAQKGFANFIKTNKLEGHAKRVYEELQKSGQDFLATNKTYYDNMMNTAWLNSLSLSENEKK